MHVRLEARVPELRRRPPREDGAEVARDLERVLKAQPVAVLFRSVGGERRGGARDRGGAFAAASLASVLAPGAPRPERAFPFLAAEE